MRAEAAPSLNILHILRAPLGGLFRHVVDLVAGQAERGHRVGMIVNSTTGGARADAALADLEPHLALGLQRVAISRELSPSDVGALRFVSRLDQRRGARCAARPRRQGRGAGAVNAERAERHPCLYAARRLAGLPAGHARRRLLSHPGMVAEVAHRPVPVREQLHRRPVPRRNRPPAGHRARRAQWRRRCRIRADRAAARRDRHYLSWRIAAGQSLRRAHRGAGDPQDQAAGA